MDWYLSGDDPGTVHALCRQIAEYLGRHGDPRSGLADADALVVDMLSRAIEQADGPLWVRLSWIGEHPELEMWDLGWQFALPSGLPTPPVPIHPGAWGTTAGPPSSGYGESRFPDAGGRPGLFLVTHLAPAFASQVRRGDRPPLTASLPVRRLPQRDLEVGESAAPALPSLEDADSNGSFSREQLLRALVVQLARAVDDGAGREIAERVSAETGLAVGGQMAAAYRMARHLVGRLTPSQIADCFVRLKYAADGRFYVIEVGPDRIVLGNGRCPFGDAVRAAPALCRITSAVFGGIAAANHAAGAAVLLSERIAVGDPGCRVVVWFGDPPKEAAPFVHRYGRAPTALAGDPPHQVMPADLAG